MILGAAMLGTLAGTSAQAAELRPDPAAGLPKVRFEDKDVVRIKMERPELEKEEFERSVEIAEDIRLALEKGDYAAFTKAFAEIKSSETIDEAQFKILVEAYAKAKAGDIAGAQTLMKSSSLAPVLNRFVMGKHLALSAEQKEALKKAEVLLKDGKFAEARVMLDASGLPAPEPKKEQVRPEEVKSALEKAKVLRSEGQDEAAAQVLLDAGISPKAVVKIEKEFDKEVSKEKKTFLQKIKAFFKIGK